MHRGIRYAAIVVSAMFASWRLLCDAEGVIPYINSTNASALAHKSWAARRARALEQQVQLEAACKAAKEATARVVNLDAYVLDRLAVVRAQIARLDERMLKVADEDKANKLAAAIARLTDVEFALANRPKPANVRPEATTRRRELSGPVGAV